MKSLLNLSMFDVLAKISTEDRGTVLTVERSLRHLMFMQAVAEEMESSYISLERIEELAKEHGGHDTLDITQIDLYTRLASLTYRLSFS